MTITLCILGYAISILLAVGVSIKTVVNSLLKITNEGKKVDLNKLQDEQMKSSNFIKYFLAAVVALVPVVNVVCACAFDSRVKKGISKIPGLDQSIIPMNQDENDRYARVGSKAEAINFVKTNLEGVKDEKNVQDDTVKFVKTDGESVEGHDKVQEDEFYAYLDEQNSVFDSRYKRLVKRRKH